MSNKKTAAAADNGQPKASLARAVSLHLEGKTQEALEQIGTLTEAGDESSELYLAKAQMEFDLEKFDQASQSYAQVLSMNPSHGPANFNLAVCLERLEQWPEAAEYFRKAADADPKRPDAALGLAVSLLRAGRPDAALEAFEQVLRIEPDNATALFGKAAALQ